MRICKVHENEIAIKGNNNFFLPGVGATVMIFFGVRMIVESLLIEGELTGVDLLGTAFLCLWTSVAVWMACYSFLSATRQIIINNHGVKCRSLFKSKFFSWAEIEDFGLSYCGQTKGVGNTYYFYFAKELLIAKNEEKKKLRGEMIKTIVIGDDFFDVINEIIPFCKRFTGVEPFISGDE